MDVKSKNKTKEKKICGKIREIEIVKKNEMK